MGVSVHERGRRPRARQLVMPRPVVVCPAGSVVYETPQGTACRCGVEEETITFMRDPSSLVHFCMSSYTLCPSWQAEKGRREAKPLIEQDNEPPKTFAERTRDLGGQVEWDPTEITYYEEG
jgi:hypothetical protein